MNYVEYSNINDAEPKQGSLWIDNKNHDVWIHVFIKPHGIMVRLKDGVFCTLPEDYREWEYTQFAGHLSIDTEALK